MKRDFAEWLLTFTDSIADYKYYIDFETIYKNAEIYKVELNMLNSLIGSQNIEQDFENLVKKFKSFQNLLQADIEELDAVDGIGEIRARTIKRSLKRMQEQFMFDNLIG